MIFVLEGSFVAVSVCLFSDQPKYEVIVCLVWGITGPRGSFVKMFLSVGNEGRGPGTCTDYQWEESGVWP